jgi:hypothetical protein
MNLTVATERRACKARGLTQLKDTHYLVSHAAATVALRSRSAA